MEGRQSSVHKAALLSFSVNPSEYCIAWSGDKPNLSDLAIAFVLGTATNSPRTNDAHCPQTDLCDCRDVIYAVPYAEGRLRSSCRSNGFIIWFENFTGYAG